MVHFKNSKDIPEVSLTVSFKTFFRLTLLILLTMIIFGAVQKAVHALLLIFIAFFLALALNAPVNWIGRHLPGKRRGSRVLATSLSYLLIVVLIGGFIASLAPALVKQTQSFSQAAPGLVRDFRSQDSETGKLIRKYKLQDQVDAFSNQLSSRLKRSGGTAFSTLQRVGTSIFSLLTILVLTFMMLVEGPAWLRFFKQMVPRKHEGTADKLVADMYRVIKGYVNGQVTLAAIASVVIAPMFFILGLSYPVALVAIVFICGLIPMIGATIGAVIVSVVALFTSSSAALIILTYYFLYQQLENYVIQPRIQSNSTNMSPLLVFMSVLVGVSFGGLFAGLVAIPLAGCLRILLLEYLRQRKIISTPQFKQATTDTK